MKKANLPESNLWSNLMMQDLIDRLLICQENLHHLLERL